MDCISPDGTALHLSLPQVTVPICSEIGATLSIKYLCHSNISSLQAFLIKNRLYRSNIGLGSMVIYHTRVYN